MWRWAWRPWPPMMAGARVARCGVGRRLLRTGTELRSGGGRGGLGGR